MSLSAGKWGLAALGIFLATSACGEKDPGQTTTPPGGGSGGKASGGSGGQPSGSGGQSSGGGSGGQSPGTGGAPGAGGAPASGSGDYFPFAVGNTWEFNVTETGLPPYKKVQRIVRAEMVGGTGPHKAVMAFRVETRKAGGIGLTDATISWQARQGTKILRYREYSCSAGSVMLMGEDVANCTKDVEDHWDPARLRIDDRTKDSEFMVNMPWPEPYTEFKARYSYANPTSPTTMNTMAMQTDTWVVKQVGASITTPAGAFSNCVVVLKTAPTGGAKTYTFCRGVGKVKEEGGVQLEVLSKYTLK